MSTWPGVLKGDNQKDAACPCCGPGMAVAPRLAVLKLHPHREVLRERRLHPRMAFRGEPVRSGED